MNLKLLSLSTLCAAVMLAGCKDKTTEEPSLSIDPAESVTLEATATSQTLTITTNQPEWMFSVDESQSWCSASKGVDNTLVVKADYNYGETERSTTITVTAGTSAKKDILTKTITVTQAGAVNQGAQLLDRAPYYEKYPEELATKASPSTVVTSGAIPLYHFGWGINNDYTFSLNFPDTQTKSYRRAILNYKMGGTNGGPNAWDYTTMIFVKDKTTGNWYEISRAITPYGGSFDASWSKTFYMDVTDYLPMLSGATEFRIYFDGDWGGPNGTDKRHTVTLTFDLYEGEPERTTVWSAKVYDSHENDNTGYRRWGYGFSGENDIEGAARMGERTFTIPANVKSIEMKATFTGYGHDQGTFPNRTGYSTNNCAEFDYNTYTVTVNGVTAAYPGTIFVECGDNYAQAGTYYFDRANFCPGNPAHTHYWKILDVPEGGGQMTLNLDLEAFISEFEGPKSDDGVASYFVEVDLFGFDK